MAEVIRVLQIVRKMDYGGIQSMLMNYYRNIDRSKVQFDFLVQGTEPGHYDGEIKSLGGKIFGISPIYPNPLKYYKEINDFFRSNKYQIVHAHHNHGNIHPLLQAYIRGVDIIISHGHGTGKERNAIKRFVKK